MVLDKPFNLGKMQAYLKVSQCVVGHGMNLDHEHLVIHSFHTALKESYGRPGREKSLYRATGLGAIAHIIMMMIMVQV